MTGGQAAASSALRTAVLVAAACTVLSMIVWATSDDAALEGRQLVLVVGVVSVLALAVARARTVRQNLVGLAAALAGVLLALSGDPAPLVLLTVAAAWIAGCVAVATAHVDAHRAGRQVVAAEGSTPSSKPSSTQVLGLALVTVVAAVLALLLVPRAESLSRLGSDSGTAGDGDPSSASTRLDQAVSGGASMDLRARGELPDSPVADVPSDSPDLWRRAVLGSYDGNRWGPSTTEAVRLRDTAGGTVVDDVLGDATGQEVARTDVVRMLDGLPTADVIAPGRPTRVIDESAVIRVDSVLVLLEPADSTYEVESVQVETDPAALRSSVGSGPNDEQLWTQLPSTVTGRTRDLAAQVVDGAASRHDAVVAVERWLEDNKSYDLDAPVAPVSDDAVDHFLFESPSGFCEHFAAATVVLLRAQGIPSRVVTGYLAPNEGGATRTIRMDDAHAWVEVFYPGVGWSPTDPTSGVPLAEDSLLDKASDAMDDLTTRIVVAVGVVLVAAAVWFVTRRLISSTGGGSPSPLLRRRHRWPVVEAFARLDAALTSTSSARAPGQALTEVCARVKRETVGMDREIDDAFSVLDRACYADRPPSSVDEQRAADVLDRITATLLNRQSEQGSR